MYREDLILKASKKLLIPFLALGLAFASGTSYQVQAADRYVTTYSDGDSVWVTSINSNSSGTAYKVGLKYVMVRGRYETDTVYFEKENGRWYYNNGSGWNRVQPNTSMNDVLYYIMNN